MAGIEDTPSELHLTCDKCRTVYRLDPARLGAAGRMVRCMQCLNMWFQELPKGVVLAETAAPGLAEQGAAALADALGAPPADHGRPYGQDDDLRVLTDGAAADDVVPGAVVHQPVLRDLPSLPPPALPMGLGATAFGLCAFFALFFPTALVLLLARQPLTWAYPPLAALYRLAGVSVTTPGEGLSLSALAAESRGQGAARELRLTARLSNIGEREAAWPALRVGVESEAGARLKAWYLRPQDYLGAETAGVFKPGATLPLKLTFRDAPADGKTAELAVAGNEKE